MVAIKIKQNERLVKDNKGLTEKTNVLAKDVVDSKKLGEALSNQLLVWYKHSN